jgi:hypothetical protein
MAKMTVEELTKSLNRDTYTPRTDEQLKQSAESRYQSIYDQKKLTAQQNFDTQDQAYQQQLKLLQDNLAMSQQEVEKNTANNIAAANRYQVTRGMQRSSYGAANQAKLQAAGNANLANLLRQYNTDASGIQDKRTLLAQQLAGTLAQYDIDYIADVNAYIDEQKQIDYDRKVAADQSANELALQLFEISQKYDRGGSSGGSRRSSGGGSSPDASAPSSDSDLFGALNRNSSASAADAQKAAIDAGRAAAVATQRNNPNTETSKNASGYEQYKKTVAKYSL